MSPSQDLSSLRIAFRSWNSALTGVLLPRIFQFLIQSHPHLNSQIYGYRRWHMGLNSWQLSSSILYSGQSAFQEEMGKMFCLWCWLLASLTATFFWLIQFFLLQHPNSDSVDCMALGPFPHFLGFPLGDIPLFEETAFPTCRPLWLPLLTCFLVKPNCIAFPNFAFIGFILKMPKISCFFLDEKSFYGSFLFFCKV